MANKTTHDKPEPHETGLQQAKLKLQKAERLLRESEKRFRGTLDNILEGCQIIGFDWRYLYLNDVVARHARMTKESLLGRKITEVFPGIENTEVFHFMRRCMKERIPKHMENAFEYPDGSKGWFELSIQPVPEGIFLLSLDITQRKRAEEDLQRSESRYRSLFTNSPDAVIVNIGDKVDLVNEACLRLFGASKAEDLVGRSIYELVHPDYHQPVREGISRLRHSCSFGPPMEHRIIRLDGTTVDTEVVAAPLPFRRRESHSRDHPRSGRTKAGGKGPGKIAGPAHPGPEDGVHRPPGRGRGP